MESRVPRGTARSSQRGLRNGIVKCAIAASIRRVGWRIPGSRRRCLATFGFPRAAAAVVHRAANVITTLHQVIAAKRIQRARDILRRPAGGRRLVRWANGPEDQLKLNLLEQAARILDLSGPKCGPRRDQPPQPRRRTAGWPIGGLRRRICGWRHAGAYLPQTRQHGLGILGLRTGRPGHRRQGPRRRLMPLRDRIFTPLRGRGSAPLR